MLQLDGLLIGRWKDGSYLETDYSPQNSRPSSPPKPLCAILLHDILKRQDQPPSLATDSRMVAIGLL